MGKWFGARNQWRGIALLVLAISSPGCFWQQKAYTDRMLSEMQNFERRAQLDRLLGPAFDSNTAEFPLWVRPPKPTQLRALTEEQKQQNFLGVFQGGDTGGPLLEFVLIGSAGEESLQEFIQKSFAAMNSAQKGPGTEVPRRDPATVNSMHGGTTSYEVFSTGGQRQAPGAAPVGYQWVYYFTEDSRQKLMLAFIVPDSNYSAFTNGMQSCLESVALGSKVNYARSGTTAPSTGPTGN